MWWDINRTLSYNALFNFIVGNRGSGKTYGSTDWAIRDFLKTGHQFVYMRRYSTEFKKKKWFFKAIEEQYPDHEFAVTNDGFTIDKEIAGYPMCLSTSKVQKSTSFPQVNKIIFDEFIIDKGVYRYLPDEVTCFLDAYETIARMRDVRVMFLSNAITISNPYFAYFNINLPYGKNIMRKGDILIELVANQEFIDAKKLTRFGKLVDGTAYGAYSIDNQFLRDSKEFIASKGEGCRYMYTLSYMGVNYGVWANYDAGMVYISYDVDESCKFTFAVTNIDHKPNTLLLSAPRKDPLFAFTIKQYELGNLRFENVKIKNVFMDILKLSY